MCTGAECAQAAYAPLGQPRSERGDRVEVSDQPDRLAGSIERSRRREHSADAHKVVSRDIGGGRGRSGEIMTGGALTRQ